MTTGQAGKSFGLLSQVRRRRRRRLKTHRIPFSSARAAMADAGIKFFNFHGMAWLSRVSTATCCGVSLAPFVRVRQRSKQRARALRCAARVARSTEAEACILVRIPLHDELGEQLF